MFRNLAEDIAYLLIKNKIVDIEKRDIYVFGVEVLLLNLLNILTALLVSIITGTKLHFLAFILVFVPLRIFSGGYHAKTSEVCYLITTATYVLSVLCVKRFPGMYSSIPALIALSVLIVPMILLAPIEHKNNSLSTYERKRNRLVSIALIAFDSLIFIALFLLSNSAATSIMIFMAINSVIMLIGSLANRSTEK